jgi:hypothetical protein
MFFFILFLGKCEGVHTIECKYLQQYDVANKTVHGNSVFRIRVTARHIQSSTSGFVGSGTAEASWLKQ